MDNPENFKKIPNPWLRSPTPNPYPRRLGVTPNGNISRVPTADGTIIRPRPLRLRLMEEDPDPTNPILDSGVYFDQNRIDHARVKAHMQALTECVVSCSKGFQQTLKPTPNVSGHVSKITFEEALLVYENNQVYYQDCIDKGSLDPSTIKKNLTVLEYWFMGIIEPQDFDDPETWEPREKTKLLTGISGYCDPDLALLIVPAPQTLRDKISHLQATIKEIPSHGSSLKMAASSSDGNLRIPSQSLLRDSGVMRTSPRFFQEEGTRHYPFSHHRCFNTDDEEVKSLLLTSPEAPHLYRCFNTDTNGNLKDSPRIPFSTKSRTPIPRLSFETRLRTPSPRLSFGAGSRTPSPGLSAETSSNRISPQIPFETGSMTPSPRLFAETSSSQISPRIPFDIRATRTSPRFFSGKDTKTSRSTGCP